jgi:hypothetical protein
MNSSPAYFFLVLALTLPGFVSFSQCETLQFSEVGSVPAHCRTSSYQSGHGILYGAATGGTPDYTYTWTNGETGQVVSNTTLQTHNAGEYYFKVVDDIGCVIDTVIKLDSVSPIADFNILSVEQFLNDNGLSVVEVEMAVTSLHWDFEYVDPSWFLAADTLNQVSVDGSSWEVISSEISTAIPFTDPGSHEICLSTANQAGCSDTICKSLTIGEWVDGSALLNITTSSLTGDFFIELLLDYPVILDVYDLSGTPVSNQTVIPGPNVFGFTTGQYIYDVLDPLTNQVLASGTFFVL